MWQHVLVIIIIIIIKLYYRLAVTHMHSQIWQLSKTNTTIKTLHYGCADTEAPLAGPYPADARRPPSAPCSVGAGSTSWTTVPTGQLADGHTPPPKRTNPASRRPQMMGTRWPIPLLSTGKPLRGETPRIIITLHYWLHIFFYSLLV